MQHFGRVACLLLTVHRPLCLDLDKEKKEKRSLRERKRERERSFGWGCQRWMLQVLWSIGLPQQPWITNTEVVIAHKPLSVLITSKDPEGWSVHVSEVLTLCSSVLIATLEAPFIQRCALCYPQPLSKCEHWNDQEGLRLGNLWEWHQINLGFHKHFPLPIMKLHWPADTAPS